MRQIECPECDGTGVTGDAECPVCDGHGSVESENDGALFPLGLLAATPGALKIFEAAGANVWDYLKRHVSGDWGELDRDDRRANDDAVKLGNRIFSAYDLPTGARVWIITEADRSSTTALLPEEY